MSPKAPITLQDVYDARRTIAGTVARTPLKLSQSLSEATGATVRLKLETVHDTRAFKIRGATNRLLHLDDAERARGVVAVSTGNHGRGVAHAARQLGMRAVVCMSELVPGNKRDAIAALGAEVRIIGRSQDEAQVEADRLVAEEGMVPVHPFDDPYVIAGQGTVGLELLEDWPELDTVLVPLSGGGLIGGIALAVKSASPGIRVVAVSMERGAAMYESIKAGKPVAVEERESLADSLGGGVGLENRYTFELVRAQVDDYLLVSEAEIARAMGHLYWQEGIVAEGGAAVGAAAMLEGYAGNLAGRNVACIVSGSNVDMKVFTEIVTGERRVE